MQNGLADFAHSLKHLTDLSILEHKNVLLATEQRAIVLWTREAYRFRDAGHAEALARREQEDIGRRLAATQARVIAAYYALLEGREELAVVA